MSDATPVGDLALDSDRTVMVPRPGGRATPGAAAAAHAPSLNVGLGPNLGYSAAGSPAAGSPAVGSPAAGSPAAGSTAGAPAPTVTISALRRHGKGLNPLVRAANSLLDVVVPLRFLAAHPSLDALRQNLIRAVKNFEAEARAADIDAQSIAVARYALCTFLDETIASTPWGGGAWAGKSLLVAFHNEAWGGEKFFVILQRLTQDPARHLHLLELMYLCLALGFEGRYRVLDDGRSQLENLRERLEKLIQRAKGGFPADLSLRWQPSTARHTELLHGMPLTAFAVAAGLLILVVRMSLILTLSHSSAPLVDQLNALHLNNAPVAPRPAAPAPRAPLSVRAMLAPEIDHGFVSVTETPEETTITLGGEAVFESGSAELVNRYKPILDRVGDALKTAVGPVVVIGHTDDRPSRSGHFRSNGELSLARAESVLELLQARTGGSERYRAEGYGDSDPLVANDSEENRARNRRVDIVVSTGAIKPPATKAAAQASRRAAEGSAGKAR